MPKFRLVVYERPRPADYAFEFDATLVDAVRQARDLASDEGCALVEVWDVEKEIIAAVVTRHHAAS